jgi:hypothetical protein
MELMVKATSYTQLGIFSGLTNVNLISEGATVYISGEHMSSASGTAFIFVAVSGVTVNGFNVTGEVTLALVQSGSFHGLKFLEFRHDCNNIDIPRIKGTGIGVLVEFNNNPGGTYDGLPHSRNIHIGLIDCNTCIYGLDAQYSMDDAVIDMLRTDTILRSMFIYGSTNITANIHSKDAVAGDADVKLWASRVTG